MADKITGALRTKFGKGAARQLRRTGGVPAVIYGHGTDPQHISLPGHELMLAVRKANALLDVDLNGESQLVLVKDVQRDPVLQILEHVDLLVVVKGEKVEVEVPVHIEGEFLGEAEVDLDAKTVSLLVEATAIPEHVSVDITGAEIGFQVFAKDLVLFDGAELATDPETLVLAIRAAADLDIPEPEVEEPLVEGEATDEEAPAAEEE